VKKTMSKRRSDGISLAFSSAASTVVCSTGGTPSMSIVLPLGNERVASAMRVRHHRRLVHDLLVPAEDDGALVSRDVGARSPSMRS